MRKMVVLFSLCLLLFFQSAIVYGSEKCPIKIKTQTTKMLFPRVGSASVVLDQGSVLVTGGSVGGPSGSSYAEIYDPLLGRFKKIGQMNVSRKNHSAIKLSNGKVLILGGVSNIGVDGLPDKTVEIFDPEINLFSVIPGLQYYSSPTTRFTANLMDDGRVLIISDYSDRNSIKVYDPITQRIEDWGKLQVKRNKHYTLILPQSEKAIIVGGEVHSSQEEHAAYNSLEILDFKTRKTELIDTASFIKTRYNSGISLAPCTSPIVFSDNTLFFSYASILFDPVSKNFTAASLNTVQEREDYQNIKLLNNKVLIIGGRYSGKVVRNNENLPFVLYEYDAKKYTTCEPFKTNAKKEELVILNETSFMLLGGYEAPNKVSNLVQIVRIK